MESGKGCWLLVDFSWGVRGVRVVYRFRFRFLIVLVLWCLMDFIFCLGFSFRIFYIGILDGCGVGFYEDLGNF